jgi:hypothetical protein
MSSVVCVLLNSLVFYNELFVLSAKSKRTIFVGVMTDCVSVVNI